MDILKFEHLRYNHFQIINKEPAKFEYVLTAATGEKLYSNWFINHYT